jgi:hypothetical protein
MCPALPCHLGGIGSRTRSREQHLQGGECGGESLSLRSVRLIRTPRGVAGRKDAVVGQLDLRSSARERRIRAQGCGIRYRRVVSDHVMTIATSWLLSRDAIALTVSGV